jgi:hypothetical protein
MNLSDTFYVALCMTVLILGVVYWFWTQNQYIQRKLNLLENIVYEMKSSMSHGGHVPDPIESVLAAAAAAGPDAPEAPAAPAPFAEDDADSIDAALDAFDTGAPVATEQPVTETPAAESDATPIAADEIFEDLTPGGAALSAGEDVSDTNNESVLNGMGLKELRELAKQKGVSNPKNLRKHELVAAIRASKTSVTPFEIREGTLELN